MNVYTHVGLDDAEKELKKMQGLENARKEMGISDKDDKPLKFIMNCNNRDILDVYQRQLFYKSNSKKSVVKCHTLCCM